MRENGTLKASYGYDQNGNRSTLVYANGITTTYAYNNANLVTSLQNKKGSTILSSYAYTYYLDGNQAAKADHAGKVTSYLYDGLGRLTKETETSPTGSWSKAYTFDATGNRATLTYAVNGTTESVTSYTYDANNRMLRESKTDGTAGNAAQDGFDYGYDNNGNQISKISFSLGGFAGASAAFGLFVFNPTGAASGESDVTIELYEYNAFNQLIDVQNNEGIHSYAYKSCSNCGEKFSFKENRNITIKCDNCHENVIIDQKKGGFFNKDGLTCPLCKKPLTQAQAIGQKSVTVDCPECSCGILMSRSEIDNSSGNYICPVCDSQFDVKQAYAKSKLVSDTGVSVIKYEGDNSTFVWKHPVEDFNLSYNAVKYILKQRRLLKAPAVVLAERRKVRQLFAQAVAEIPTIGHIHFDFLDCLPH